MGLRLKIAFAMAGKAGGALENVLRAINPLGKRIKAKI